MGARGPSHAARRAIRRHHAPAVYVSENGGRSFRELASFRALPDYARWTFPPAPHTAHIRHIVLDARLPDDILIGVEEGGVARSRDRGVTWEDASGPPSDTASPPRKTWPAAAATRRAITRTAAFTATSTRSWPPARPETFFRDHWPRHLSQRGRRPVVDHLTDGLPVAYSLLVAAHPAQPDRLFVGAAGNGPPGWKGWRPARGGPYASSRYRLDFSEKLGGAKTVIFRTDDAGDHWRAPGRWPARRAPVRHLLAAGPSRQSRRAVRRLRRRQRLRERRCRESWRQLNAAYPKAFGARVFRSV